MGGGGRGSRSYKDLDVWQASMSLAVSVYRFTGAFPRDELFGLTSQMRRASASIPANIAEGYGRAQRRSFAQFLRIAQGSTKELETHAILASRVGLLPMDDALHVERECDRIGRMLRNLIGSLNDPGEAP
ncbi:four helix bundle protein [Alsobacter sp. KACC 23698]|uniref:Four helix bundle protein n=1 Tax=Alsobacter sp. KACC 23698 TaxID=3149229 RepID=A0AAU7JLY7_9HYPH